MRTLGLISLMSWMFLVTNASAEISEKYVNESLKKAAKEVKVPYLLLKAICAGESNLKPDGYFHGDGVGNNHAIGLCQVLVKTAEDYGFNDPNCYNDFRNAERSYKTCKLFGPYTNAKYAAKYLKFKLDTHDGSWINAVAAYNSGTIKVCPKKGSYLSRRGLQGEHLEEPREVKCIPGELINRKYVDRILKYFKKWSEDL